MAFTVPSRQELHDDFISDYALAQPDKNVSRGSDPYRLGRVLSGWLWAALARLLFFFKQMLPDQAEAAYLERWGSVFAFLRRAAVGSVGSQALTVTGTPAASVTEGAELTHEDGTRYQVTSVAATIGGGGTVDVDIEAISTGSATNKIAGEVLSFTSPPAGVDTLATIAVSLSGGLNIEDYEEYRPRLIAHIGDPPSGGAIHDYVEWCKEILGIKDAYVWTHRRGVGTIDLAVLGYGTGSARIPTSTVLSDLDQHIEEVRPGNVRDFVILATVEQTQAVTAQIEIDETRYKWDWDDLGVGYAVTADSSGASTITVPTAPSTVIAGVRITVQGEEALVTARVGNVLTVSFENDYDGNPVSWFTFTPTGQDIRASGDVVKPVKNAILALFNTLGPARSSFSATNWQADLRLSKLYAAITDVDGVDDCPSLTPAATVTITDAFTPDNTITFLTPGFITVVKYP